MTRRDARPEPTSFRPCCYNLTVCVVAGAELAAAEALHALQHGVADAHLRLHEARRRAFAGKWRFNRGMRALVSSPAAVRAAGMGATSAPAILQRVICYAGDLRAA